MKYIRVIGSGCPTQYMADYNTRHYSEEELADICREWNEQDGTGIYEIECASSIEDGYAYASDNDIAGYLDCHSDSEKASMAVALVRIICCGDCSESVSNDMLSAINTYDDAYAVARFLICNDNVAYWFDGFLEEYGDKLPDTDCGWAFIGECFATIYLAYSIAEKFSHTNSVPDLAISYVIEHQSLYGYRMIEQ